MNASGKETFLIDGFPRNKDNLDGWNRQMGDKANVKGVLFFECSEKICVERCLERGKSSGRSDDNEESLTKRFFKYLTKLNTSFFEKKRFSFLTKILYLNDKINNQISFLVYLLIFLNFIYPKNIKILLYS